MVTDHEPRLVCDEGYGHRDLEDDSLSGDDEFPLAHYIEMKMDLQLPSQMLSDCPPSLSIDST